MTINGRRILARILSNPLFHVPLILAVVFLFATPVLRAWSIAGILSSLTIALLGALYTVLSLGDDAPRPQPDLPSGELLQGEELRTALVLRGASPDLIELFDRFSLILREADTLIEMPGVSEHARLVFHPLVKENGESAHELFNYLLFVDEHLRAVASPSVKGLAAKVRDLTRQRDELVNQLERIIAALEKVAIEVPRITDQPVDDARERLARLEESLDTARRAYQRLRTATLD